MLSVFTLVMGQRVSTQDGLVERINPGRQRIEALHDLHLPFCEVFDAFGEQRLTLGESIDERR